LINLCGFHAGPPGELLGPSADNPRGYWESSWLVGFNDDLLFLFGENWRTGGLVDVESLPPSVLQDFERRAETWTDSMDQQGPWMAKDPRLCLTGLFWLRFRPAARVVLAVRHPEATITSMLNREHSPVADPQVALQTWRRHLFGAVSSTRGRSRLVVDYDRMIDDLRGELRRILDWLPDLRSDTPPFADVLQAASQEIVRDLRHHDGRGMDPRYCEPADLEAWEALGRGDEPAVESVLRRWALQRSSFDVQRMLHRRRRDLGEISVDELKALLEMRTRQLGDQTREIHELEGKNREQQETLEAMRAAVGDRDARIRSQSSSIRELRLRYEEQRKGVESLQADIAARDERIRCFDSAVRELELQIGEQGKQVELLHAAVAAREERIRSTDVTLQNREDQIAAKDTHIENLGAIKRQLELQAALAEKEVASLKRSWSYRVGRVIVYPGSVAKRVLGTLRRRRDRNTQEALSEESEPGNEHADCRERYDRLRERPLISIVMPVYNTPSEVLRQSVQSVFDQAYRNWQLCIADDGSDEAATLDVLQGLERRDRRRVKITRLPRNQGIAAASNAAAELATGEFVAFLDHDDLLTPDALLEVAQRLERVPDADLVYSDEDKISMDGRRSEPFHKPDFSPEYLLSSNYICHFTAMRRTIFKNAGCFRVGFDGSQDYDLILRATELARRVEHIPKILYHWRKVPGSAAGDAGAKGGLWRESSRKALQSAVERRAWKADVLNGSLPGTYRVKFAVDPSLHVTIIIPTENRADLLQKCVDSILRHTRHPSFEILVVCNNCENATTREYLERRSKSDPVRFIDCNIPFNYSRINNLAVEECESPFLLFLNDDIEITVDGWLSSMLEFAQERAIGGVGARLLYPNDTIQHAGVVVGMLGVAGHLHRHMPADQPGYFGWADTIRNSSAVTGACLMTRREVFNAVGGFTEGFTVAFNDIDWCLKVREAGFRIVYTPYARAYHHEMASRGSDATPEAAPRFRREIAGMLARWGHLISSDPFYNPNLTLMSEDCGISTAEDRRRFEEYMRQLRLLPGESERAMEADGAAALEESGG
jgi:GT2 family glycosyltransferase